MPLTPTLSKIISTTKNIAYALALWGLLIGSVALMFYYPVIAVITLCCIAGCVALKRYAQHKHLDVKFIECLKATKEFLTQKIQNNRVYLAVAPKIGTFFDKIKTFLFGGNTTKSPASPERPGESVAEVLPRKDLGAGLDSVPSSLLSFRPQQTNPPEQRLTSIPRTRSPSPSP